MAVRILSWNMYNFRANLVRRAAAVRRILKVVNPVAGPNYDILVVIEPGCAQSLDPGDLAAGDGVLGIFKLLSKLQHRHAGWRVAPPLALCTGAKAETLAVFYNSDTVAFEGPRRSQTLTQPWNSAAADDGRVYWYDHNGTVLRRAGLAGNNAASQGTGANATAITLDVAANKVFWVNTNTHRLWSSDLTGGAASAMPVLNVYANRLRLDTVHQRIYWVDTNANQIRRVDYSGANATTITPTLPMGTARQPVDLALDMEFNVLYWSNAAGTHRLQWCDLDGNGNADFPPTGLTRPDCLTIDFARAVLYWVDTGTDTIQSSDLQGNGVRNRFNQGGVQPRQLTLHMARKKMYFVDAATNDIWGSDMDGNNAAAIVTGDVPVSLAIDPARSTLWWVDTNGNRVRKRVLGGATSNVVTAGTPQCLAVHPGSSYVGQCTFQNAMGGNISFPQAYQRRPYLCRFRDLSVVGPNNTFLLLAAHSPAPNYQTAKKAAQTGKGSANNLDAQNGTARLASIREITTLRGGEPALIVGDFNCCAVPALQLAQCANNGPGHANDRAVLTNFGGGFTSHMSTRTSLKQPGGNATYAQHTSHAYDHILTVGFTTVNHARLKNVIVEKADRRAAGGPGSGAGLTQAQFQACHHAYWKTTGVSDHLPVEVQVTI
jgi:sugar lactone lactonase YvrE